MGKAKKFLPWYPDDYEIFEERLEVVGIVHRKEAALRFAQGNRQALKLQSEPSNPYDRNAIRVIGVWTDSSGREKNTHVGYLEKDLAKLLTQNDYLSRVLPRLESIFLGGHSDEWVGIYFQILGPKGGLAKYKALWKAQGKVDEDRSTEAKARETETVLYNDDEEDWVEVPRKTDEDEGGRSTLGCLWFWGVQAFLGFVVLAMFQPGWEELLGWWRFVVMLVAVIAWLSFTGLLRTSFTSKK